LRRASGSRALARPQWREDLAKTREAASERVARRLQ
jgi:hypothetical protein